MLFLSRRSKFNFFRGYERTGKSYGELDEILQKYQYLTDKLDNLNLLLKDFIDIDKKKGKVLNQLNDSRERRYALSQIKTKISICCDLLLDLFAMVDCDALQVEIMNFTKHLHRLMKSLDNAFLETGSAHDVCSGFEATAFHFVSLRIQSHVKVNRFSKREESFKKKAKQLLQTCKKKSAFDADMFRETARKFFEINNLKIDKMIPAERISDDEAKAEKRQQVEIASTNESSNSGAECNKALKINEIGDGYDDEEREMENVECEADPISKIMVLTDIQFIAKTIGDNQ